MSDSNETARAWVEIDLGALVANARTLQAACGGRLLPMLKANGYGLGAAAVARALETVDPWGFGVATTDEGASLRRSGVERPILVATPLIARAIDACLAENLRPTIGDLEALRAWCERSSRPFHLEIDTGLGRAGLRWDDQASLAAVGAVLARAAGWEGVFTHFHSADSDPASIECQWHRFEAALAALPHRPPLVHAANSAAALRGTKYAADLVRPGIFLYGGSAGEVAPWPVAALRARVLAVRELPAGESVSYGATWRAPERVTIATLGLGYADGFPRAANVVGSPTRLIELRGRTAPVVGRVTMDLTMVAVDGPVMIGDVATVFGGIVSLDAQAGAAGTVSYELLTALGPRLPRFYVHTPTRT